MPTAVAPGIARKAKKFPLYRTLPRLVHDPIRELERISRTAGGEVVQLNLGASRPLLVTHPDHVQHVLRENPANYARDGEFWRPLDRLLGDSILAEGEPWRLSRAALQPVFTSRHVNALTGRLAAAVNEAVDLLAAPAADGRAVHVGTEMSRLVNASVTRVFFGGRISPADAGRLSRAIDEVAGSLAFRFLLPFVPGSIRLPGDRRFQRGLDTIDAIMSRLTAGSGDRPREDPDIFSALHRARTAAGSALTDAWVRDNLTAMFGAGVESTTVALTWLWTVLHRHPKTAARLSEEVAHVVGGGEVRPEHLPHLPYTRQVVQELLRLYPVGWMFPRVAVGPGNIGGVAVKSGQSVLISPWLTHRLESAWDRPLEFDPDRFDDTGPIRRHRYAYFPFGGGVHQCIGMHVFHVEAQLILAALLSRFRPALTHLAPVKARIGATLRPKQELMMTLTPVGRAG